MARHSNGFGTYEKRGKTWRGRMMVNGLRISSTGRTKLEAKENLEREKTRIEQGYLYRKDDITTEEWIDIWLEKKVYPKMTEQSASKYEAMMKLHIIPVFGKYRLRDLTREVLEIGYAEMFQKKVGKEYQEENYSRSTVISVSGKFKRCLQYAVECKILIENPHDGVELGKLRPAKEVTAYTIEEHRKIVEYTRTNGQYYWVFYMLIATGMRFGEVVALTWDDVDFEKKMVSISKTSVELHGSPHIQDKTKTQAGKRIIVVPDRVIEFLSEVKASQDPAQNYRNLVFPNRNYGINTAANARKRFIRMCGELDITYRGIHALRHTWATRALEQGIDVKTVSSMLGHKNVITTMNIYQHVYEEQKAKVAETMNDLF